MKKQNRPLQAASCPADISNQIKVLAVKDDSLDVEQIAVDVSAMRGVWAVHRTVSRGRIVPRRWSISHAPTGKTMAADLKTKREGLLLAERLLDLPVGNKKELPVETRLGFRKILREIRSQQAA